MKKASKVAEALGIALSAAEVRVLALIELQQAVAAAEEVMPTYAQWQVIRAKLIAVQHVQAAPPPKAGK